MKPILTLGSDPELHLFDREEGRVVSSLRILKRDKHKPISLGDGIRMYADNVLVETSFPPVSDVTAMMIMLRNVWVRMQERLGDRFRLLPKAAHLYPKSELRGRKCWETGCNPNFDAYAKALNAPASFNDGLRTGSFHLHVGHPKLEGNSLPPKELMVMLLDVIVGCASILFDKDETAPLRRALYGKAGEFRPTPYGCEYRVLGNYSLSQPKLAELVWDLVSHTIACFEKGLAHDIIGAMERGEVPHAINTNNKTLARAILKRAELPAKLMARVEAEYPALPFNAAWGI